MHGLCHRQHSRVFMVYVTIFPIADMTEAGAEQHFHIDTMIREIQQDCTWKKDFNRRVAVLVKASA